MPRQSFSSDFYFKDEQHAMLSVKGIYGMNILCDTHTLMRKK